jgi:hypothetical protein
MGGNEYFVQFSVSSKYWLVFLIFGASSILLDDLVVSKKLLECFNSLSAKSVLAGENS